MAEMRNTGRSQYRFYFTSNELALLLGKHIVPEGEDPPLKV